MERVMVLFIAKKWWLNSEMYTYKDKKRIAKAASRQVAYDYEFHCEFSSNQFFSWQRQLYAGIDNRTKGENGSSSSPLVRASAGSRKYVETWLKSSTRDIYILSSVMLKKSRDVNQYIQSCLMKWTSNLHLLTTLIQHYHSINCNYSDGSPKFLVKKYLSKKNLSTHLI